MLAERDKERRIGSERDDREGGGGAQATHDGADGRGCQLDALAPHRAGDVDYQRDRTAGPTPFPHDDVGLGGKRMGD